MLQTWLKGNHGFSCLYVTLGRRGIMGSHVCRDMLYLLTLKGHNKPICMLQTW